MATYKDFEQVKAFARVDGVLVTLLWTVSFVCAMKMGKNPMLFLVALGIGAWSLAYAALRLKRFRDQVLDGFISYRRALAYSILTYLYASLLFAVVQYLYFQFIDGGEFLRQQLVMLNDPEAQKMMQQVYGLTKEDISFVVQNIGALTPIRIAMQFFTMDVMLGVFVSIPVALLMKREKKSVYGK
ncbi:MAG: DUF4199 domain-containing protein [Prevotella sp.]|nr:DUF4199 domain-containing protein [Prevotella sp.]